VLLGDLKSARTDIDLGLKLVPTDPFASYLSSGLAMREGDLARAQKDIATALSLAPTDPNVLLHAGNVAGAAGDQQKARELYTRVVATAPASGAGKAAQAALAANPSAPQPQGAEPQSR
jgi:tetratricopeptide (TPR) repeat protein